MTHAYDAFGRRTNFTLNTPSMTQYQFSYDNASRLASVKDGTYSANYSYLANSPLVSQIGFRQGNAVWMTTSKQYDNLNRLTSIASTHAGPTPTSFAYQYNDANQRTRMTLADGSYWTYQYGSLGQLTSGKRSWSDNVPVAGQQFEYGFNDIGDRTSTKEGGDATGGGLRTRTYSPNLMNQGSRSVMNSVDILGMADAGTSVTVNGQTAYRKGNYFQSLVTVDTSGGDVNQTITVTGGGMSGSGKAYFASGSGGWEQAQYDLEGNLTSQGRWSCTWDPRNRLTKVESLGSAPMESRRRVEMEYDWQGRRIKKTVSTTANGTTWTVQTVRKYVYDGWNVVAEVDGNNNLVQSYLWGLDLSGTMQGAGGVGGLLAVKPGNGIASFAAMDGNGNVVGLANGSAGPSVNGTYEYGPFGEPIRVTGTLGKANPFRWSTKFTDDETDLVYYGYRYYNPSTGRWLSRDPIEEDGGPNLYAFTRNNPISAVDPSGLAGMGTVQGPTAGVFAWIAPFSANDVDLGAFAQSYINLTSDFGIGANAGAYRNFLGKVRIGIGGLAGSANSLPGSKFDPSSQQTRGWLRLPMNLTCACDGQVKSWEAEKLMTSSTGFTPMPLGGFSPGVGGPSITCNSFGSGVYCNAFERSRVGPPGFNIAMALFPMAGVPYRWSRIEYILRCDRSYEIHYSASSFPSAQAYLNGNAVGPTLNQSGLPEFMFAGNGADAPGSRFHVERGKVP